MNGTISGRFGRSIGPEFSSAALSLSDVEAAEHWGSFSETMSSSAGYCRADEPLHRRGGRIIISSLLVVRMPSAEQLPIANDSSPASCRLFAEGGRLSRGSPMSSANISCGEPSALAVSHAAQVCVSEQRWN